MPEQNLPIVILKEPDGGQYKIWLDKDTTRGEIELTMHPDLYLEEVTQIITKRLAQYFGFPPDTDIEPGVASFAYNKTTDSTPEEMFAEAKNVLGELKSHCNGKHSVAAELKAYSLQMDEGGVGPDPDMESDRVLALKPVLHKDQVEAALEEAFRKIPKQNLSTEQRVKLREILIPQLSEFPRPEVWGSTSSEKAKNMGENADTLFLGIKMAVMQVLQVMPVLPETGLILPETGIPPETSELPFAQKFMVGEIYDAVQKAYKERAGEMTP